MKQKPSKRPQDDTFSFKAPSSKGLISEYQQSLSSSRSSQKQPYNNFEPRSSSFIGSSYQQKNPLNKIQAGIYRHQQQQNPPVARGIINSINNDQSSIVIFPSQTLHPSIDKISQQMEQNIQRRLQLEAELNTLKKYQNGNHGNVNNSLSNIEEIALKAKPKESVVAEQFQIRNRKLDFLDSKSNNNKVSSYTSNQQHLRKDVIQQERQKITDENIRILTGNDLNHYAQKIYDINVKKNSKNDKFYRLEDFLTLQQAESQQQQTSQKSKKSTGFSSTTNSLSQPSLIQIQSMVHLLTFPETPSKPLNTLLTKCQKMYTQYKAHSDVIYCMMVIHFHLKHFQNVRKYFKEILMFKRFEPKAYWIAAETEYELENYQGCNNLLENCLNGNANDKYFPRFIYLRARCYYQMGNFTHSIVCYNQLIRIRPKIAEYFLKRAILYDKLGYEKESKEDYLMFTMLKPQAKEYLQQKIMLEDNNVKRKELMQIYAKMI